MKTNPITPPPELVKQWASAFYGTTIAPGEAAIAIATQAAQWGADQELDACLEHLFRRGFSDADILCLRAARRPKPPTLKEQALEALEALPTPAGQVTADRLDTIRLALEALPE